MLAALKATLGGGAPAADGHDAAVARGLAAADATRSSSALPLRPDALDAATQSAIIEAVAAYDAMLTAQEDHDASGGGGDGASATKNSGDAGGDSSQLYVRYVRTNKSFHKGERECSGSGRWSESEGPHQEAGSEPCIRMLCKHQKPPCHRPSLSLSPFLT